MYNTLDVFDELFELVALWDIGHFELYRSSFIVGVQYLSNHFILRVHLIGQSVGKVF